MAWSDGRVVDSVKVFGFGCPVKSEQKCLNPKTPRWRRGKNATHTHIPRGVSLDIYDHPRSNEAVTVLHMHVARLVYMG